MKISTVEVITVEMSGHVKDCPAKVILATIFDEIRVMIKSEIERGQNKIWPKTVMNAIEAAECHYDELLANYVENEDPYHNTNATDVSEIKCLAVFYGKNENV